MLIKCKKTYPSLFNLKIILDHKKKNCYIQVRRLNNFFIKSKIIILLFSKIVILIWVYNEKLSTYKFLLISIHIR